MKTQNEYIHKLQSYEEQTKDTWIRYWRDYSSFDTWQFWVNLILLISPLIVLYFYIDRNKVFLLGFYGFAVHIFFSYIDAFGTIMGCWFYPYKIVPIMPINFMLDVSLIPVSFMLLFQWTLNKEKNYYLFIFLLSAIYAFIVKPLMVAHKLFLFDKSGNYFYLFVGYIIIALSSKWLVDFFLFPRKE